MAQVELEAVRAGTTAHGIIDGLTQVPDEWFIEGLEGPYVEVPDSLGSVAREIQWHMLRGNFRLYGRNQGELFSIEDRRFKVSCDQLCM